MRDIQIADKDKPFLEKVMRLAGLPDIYDARDVTLVVFRTMRDLMTTEVADRAAAEFTQDDVAQLWKDTNPIVAFLSRLRPPLTFDSKVFLRRINQEAGLPKAVEPETAVKAVFSATKDELSPERVQEIANFLPDRIQEMWVQAKG